MESIIPSFAEFTLRETSTSLHIQIGDKETARAVAHNQKNEIAAVLRQLNKKDAHLEHGSGKFRILASMGLPPDEQRTMKVAAGKPDLLNASQLDILEFLAEKERERKIVILTWHINSARPNRAFYTSDRLTTQRGILTPSQFHDFDYLQSWRSADPSLQKFNQLCNTLDRDNYVPEYEYELIRPDGALVWYQTDFFKLRNRFGEEIRAGVSDPSAYRVIKHAEPSIK